MSAHLMPVTLLYQLWKPKCLHKLPNVPWGPTAQCGDPLVSMEKGLSQQLLRMYSSIPHQPASMIYCFLPTLPQMTYLCELLAPSDNIILIPSSPKPPTSAVDILLSTYDSAWLAPYYPVLLVLSPEHSTMVPLVLTNKRMSLRYRSRKKQTYQFYK